MGTFSFAPEANLKSPSDVKDLQGGEGCEESRREQCNPGYREVGTSGPRTPAGPHPGTGTEDSIKLITIAGLYLMNTAFINCD